MDICKAFVDGMVLSFKEILRKYVADKKHLESNHQHHID